MTLTTNLQSGEKIGDVALNSTVFDSGSPSVIYSLDSLDPGQATLKSNPQPNPAIGSNVWAADGDGNYDFALHFDPSGAGQFTGTEKFIFDLTGTGLNASTFKTGSLGQGGEGTYMLAISIQSLPGGSSTWAGDPTVPEPTTMIAGALLLVPFGASTLRILRKNRKA